LAICLSALLGIPADVLAAPDTPGQKAGEVRGNSSGEHCPRQQDYIGIGENGSGWADVVNTQAGARARIALDDGSVLNVDRIVDQSGQARRRSAATELELTSEKIRSQAQKNHQADGNLK